MPLFLMRHGPAEAARDGDDHGRALSPEGRRLVERAGAGMEAAGYVPDRVLSSPYPRALQTAEAVAAPFGLPVVADEALALGADAAGLVALWEAVRGEAKAPLFVGHQPELEDALALLTGTRVAMPPGALVVVTQDRGRPPVFSRMLLAETLAAFAPPDAS